MQGLSEAAAISEQSGWGQRMSKGATKPGTVIGFPCAVTDAVRDETVASIVDVLQEQLRFAREGKLRGRIAPFWLRISAAVYRLRELPLATRIREPPAWAFRSRAWQGGTCEAPRVRDRG